MEAVSCDELYADLTDVCEQTGGSPLDVASVIRKQILLKTCCTASAGIGTVLKNCLRKLPLRTVL